MNLSSWAAAYEETVDAFGGQTPGHQLETQLISDYKRDPEAYARAVQKITVRYDAGRVHSPWPLVHRELEAVEQRRHVHADRHAKQIRIAEIWVRNVAGSTVAGEPAITESDAEAVLFDQDGLAPAADHEQRDRLLALWRSLSSERND